MNKLGQVTILYAFMLALVIILFAIAIAPALMTFVNDARAPDSASAVGLDCSNSSISNYDKANCVAVDSLLPFTVLFILALAGVVIGAKVIFS